MSCLILLTRCAWEVVVEDQRMGADREACREAKAFCWARAGGAKHTQAQCCSLCPWAVSDELCDWKVGSRCPDPDGGILVSLYILLNDKVPTDTVGACRRHATEAWWVFFSLPHKFTERKEELVRVLGAWPSLLAHGYNETRLRGAKEWKQKDSKPVWRA